MPAYKPKETESSYAVSPCEDYLDNSFETARPCEGEDLCMDKAIQTYQAPMPLTKAHPEKESDYAIAHDAAQHYPGNFD